MRRTWLPECSLGDKYPDAQRRARRPLFTHSTAPLVLDSAPTIIAEPPFTLTALFYRHLDGPWQATPDIYSECFSNLSRNNTAEKARELRGFE
jgi:hypothetical protein